MYFGIRSNLRGLNLVGLKRKGVNKNNISKINNIFKKIFDNKSTIEKNILNLTIDEKKIEEIAEIISFISLNLKRGISRFTNA